MMSEESRLRSSFPRSERIPIVTLSKSMRRAALGAWAEKVAWIGAADIVCACGPRWMGVAAARTGVAERGCRGFMSSSSLWLCDRARPRVRSLVTSPCPRPVDGQASRSDRDQDVLTTHAQICSPRHFVGDTDRADAVQLREEIGRAHV